MTDDVRLRAGREFLHAEELPPGLVVDLGTHRVSEEEVVSFARRWDPLPMHVDPVAARATGFGGLVASGVHTMAIFQRLQVDRLLARTAIVAGLGFDRMRLTAPVRPGHELHGSVTVTGNRPRPGRGDAVVATTGRLVDQDGTTVFELDAAMLVRSSGS